MSARARARFVFEVLARKRSKKFWCFFYALIYLCLIMQVKKFSAEKVREEKAEKKKAEKKKADKQKSRKERAADDDDL